MTLLVAVLTVLGLAATGLSLRIVVQHRVDTDASRELNRTLATFRTFVSTGTDPVTHQKFTDSDDLLRAFLARVVPPSDQGLVAVPVHGEPFAQGATTVERRTRQVAALAARDAGASDDGAVLDDVDGRRLLLATVAVPDDEGTAYLVVAHDQAASAATVGGLVRTFVLVALAVLVLVSALAWSTAGRVLLPLRRLSETAELITASDLTRRVPESGTDDVASLQRTVNAMLDRLEQAFASQRGLLDDVGHELRTPLTVLRGHLELLNTAQPERVERTRELLLDEVARMTRLVEELLLLAQSQRPDFLRIAPVQLDALVADMAAKAEVMADRTWTRQAPPRSASVTLDAELVTQAVLQLVDNAVRHTRDGEVIRIGADSSPGEVRLWVHDDGPGVAPADRGIMFQRFGRGHRDRDDTRSNGHHGLGLSIVAAIATGHGGRVELDDEATGARFVLVVPQPVLVEPAVVDDRGSQS